MNSREAISSYALIYSKFDFVPWELKMKASVTAFCMANLVKCLLVSFQYEMLVFEITDWAGLTPPVWRHVRLHACLSVCLSVCLVGPTYKPRRLYWWNWINEVCTKRWHSRCRPVHLIYVNAANVEFLMKHLCTVAYWNT